MKSFHRKTRSALALVTLIALAAGVQAQQGPGAGGFGIKSPINPTKVAADAAKAASDKAAAAVKNVVVPPNPLLARPFDPKVGPALVASTDKITAILASVTTPAQAAPAMASVMQMGPNHAALEKEFAIQIEQIAAAQVAGKKTPEMTSMETTVMSVIPAKGQALEDQVTRLSKLQLTATDMATLQNMRKGLLLD